MAINEKREYDSATSGTLESASQSVDERAQKVEADDAAPQGFRSQSATPVPSVKNENTLQHVATGKEAEGDLKRINTSPEGSEYPTGVKLGLISLALCLSVFLMALVRANPPSLGFEIC